MLKLMDQLPDYLPAAAKFAITVAVGCACILEPILTFINGISPRSPVLDAAVAFVLVVLPVIYLMGVILMYVQVTPQAAAPQPGGALRRFADLACALAFLLILALAAFLFLAMAGSFSPPSGGLMPT
ncbi:hypothetical protein QOZ80_6BG0464470 [Eleusine coracana subsp. coracana]|nr:hypothetical protein QOZ80_6BG0464470 [Eleusine coracana subsp. coracana]